MKFPGIIVISIFVILEEVVRMLYFFHNITGFIFDTPFSTMRQGLKGTEKSLKARVEKLKGSLKKPIES